MLTLAVVALLSSPRRVAVLLTALTLAWSVGRARGDDLCGCWEGEWHSTTEVFQGTVKAQITKCGPNKYECVFTGRAFKVMPYRYKSILIGETDPQTGRVRFRCTQKLPLWGCYWMKGWAQGCQFRASYHTDENAGCFTMRKVACD